jgi:hypothetical protein
MLINKLYRQQRIWSVLLTLGMLLQIAIPLLDGTLVYRFSNWLTHESSLEASQIQLLRTQAHSIEDLAHAVAKSTKELPCNSSDSEEARPIADTFLQSFLAQSDAQRATKEAATTAKAPQKPTALQTYTNFDLAFLGYTPLAHFFKAGSKYGASIALFQLRKQARSSLGKLSFPPTSGQSTLAP